MWTHDEIRVFAVAGVDLRVVDDGWPFADRHRAEIEAHWQRRIREAPGFFNGVVHMLKAYTLRDGVLAGRFIRVAFQSFLYWRETGYRDPGVMDAFGSGLILSAEGAVLLGRQQAGNLNSGLCYPPGGFIDARDVGPDGRIDLDGSVAREIAEETGLAPPAIQRADGYVVTIAGPSLSIAVPYRSPLSGAALLGEAGRHIAGETDAELVDVVLATPGEDFDRPPVPPYAEALLNHIPGLKILA